MSAGETPDPLRERNRRTARFLIGWIIVLALVSLIVGMLRGNP